MNNIPRVSPCEKLICPDYRCFGEKVMLRPEQQAVNWTLDVVSNCYKVGELVMINFAGNPATGKAVSEMM